MADITDQEYSIFPLIDYLEEKTNPNKIKQAQKRLSDVSLLKADHNEVSVNVEEDSWPQIVRLERTVEDWKITCNCSTYKWCDHQTAALLFISKKGEESLLRYWAGDPFTAEREAYCVENDLPLTFATAQHLELNFDEDFSLEFNLVGDLEGLVSSNDQSEEAQPVWEPIKISAVLKLKSSQTARDGDQVFQIGFFFEAREEPQHPLKLVPVLGQVKKSAPEFRNPIKLFHNHSQVIKKPLNEDERKLLALESELDSINHKYGQEFGSFQTDRLVPGQKVFEKQLRTLKVLHDYHASLNALRFIYVSKSPLTNWGLKSADLKKIHVAVSKAQLKFKMVQDEDTYGVDCLIKVEGKWQKANELTQIDPVHTCFFTIAQRLYIWNSLEEALAFKELQQKQVRVFKKDINLLVSNYLEPISQSFQVELGSCAPLFQPQVLSADKQKVYLFEFENQVIFKPVVSYGNDSEFELIGPENTISTVDGELTILERDQDWEDGFKEVLGKLHPSFQEQITQGAVVLDIKEMLKGYWFFDAFNQLEASGVEIFGLDQLDNFKYSRHKAQINYQIDSGQDWFEVNIGLAFGDNVLSMKDLRKAVIAESPYVKLSDGTLGIIPEEWFARLKTYFRHGQVKDDHLEISKMRFSILDELFAEHADQDIINEISERRRRLAAFEEIKEIALPDTITATLRDYQVYGLNWLAFLHEYGWGGILADDMGLGKTLQIICILAKRIKESDRPNLIIVPATLIFNWSNELEKFFPSSKVYFHHGSERRKDKAVLLDKEIVITTYGTLVKDIEMLSDITFGLAVLDESQAIKNVSSQRYKAACLLKAESKMAMTGTPIENHTFDLFAQMNFVNPGFLGTAESFKRDYANRIDKDRDVEITAELNRIIKPFILRRTKEQVAKELPPKTEEIIYCQMEPQQRKVYDAVRNEYRNFLLQKVDQDGIGKTKLYVLEGLTKLRLICDSTALIENGKYGAYSVKQKAILEHIKDKVGGHKVLIFSQFVKMLTRVRKDLDASGIPYAYLDGKSNQQSRRDNVDKFQTDPECKVFLLSLKAGGTGLNLTAADYVFLLDPWWNPAVENQAIDRCYRIGQDKKVFAYRMICTNTVEEKIISLQQRKKQLAGELIQAEESFVKNLSKDDVADLFS